MPWSILHHNVNSDLDRPSPSVDSTGSQVVTGSILPNGDVGSTNLMLREPSLADSSATLGPFGCVAGDSVSVRLEELSPDDTIRVGWYVVMDDDDSSSSSFDSDSDGTELHLPRERHGHHFNAIVSRESGRLYSNGQGEPGQVSPTGEDSTRRT